MVAKNDFLKKFKMNSVPPKKRAQLVSAIILILVGSQGTQNKLRCNIVASLIPHLAGWYHLSIFRGLIVAIWEKNILAFVFLKQGTV